MRNYESSIGSQYFSSLHDNKCDKGYSVPFWYPYHRIGTDTQQRDQCQSQYGRFVVKEELEVGGVAYLLFLVCGALFQTLAR